MSFFLFLATASFLTCNPAVEFFDCQSEFVEGEDYIDRQGTIHMHTFGFWVMS